MMNELLASGKIVAVDENYLTEDGAVLIRANGTGTSQYWVRDDDLETAYRSAGNAYYQKSGMPISRMRRGTAYNIISSIRYYLENN